MVVIVNPNSPTGRVVPRAEMERVVKSCPETIFWVDETYIDFVDRHSLEGLVAECDNLIISKSMSKFYGLSGLRVGYLVGSTNKVSEWERLSPPWSVGLLGQLGAIEALLDSEYYKAQVIETMVLREELVLGLAQMGIEPVPSVTNYIFGRLPGGGVADLVAGLANRDIFIRDANNLSPRFEDDWLRIAVKDRNSQSRLLRAMQELRA